MFKRLKRRILLMDLAILTVILIVVFVALYAMTYDNIWDRINEDLLKVHDFRKEMTAPPEVMQDTPEMMPEREVPERTVSFVIQTDYNGNLAGSFAPFDADDEFFENAMELTTSEKGSFELDGSKWAYLKREFPDHITYAYLDITSQSSVLDRMVKTFLIVFAASFVLIFIVSNVLSNRTLKPIKEAFEKQKQFVSDASHELRTPLTVIGTNVDLLLSDERSDEDKKWLKYIRSEVDRMGSLTKDLLFLAQMNEANRNTLEKEQFNLSDEIDTRILASEAVAFEAGVSLESEIDKDIDVTASRSQLAQVFMILLDNAIKYSGEGEKVFVELSEHSGHATLSVSNTGSWIPESELENVFDRFYKGDSSRTRKVDSYGLGLSIAKAIVENHGGKISCESVKGEKTTFSVRLRI